MHTVVIIPTYNEAPNVAGITAAVRGAAPDADVLVVDDGSPDGTGEIADRLANESGGRIRVLHREAKEGLGAAYLAAYRWALAAGYDRVATMDADFSHDPGYLPALLRASEHADVVIGSRYVPGGGVRNWSLLRRCISKWGGAYARFVLGLRVRDPTAGFQVFSRRALEVVLEAAPRTNGYGFQVEQKYASARAGLSIVEVPIVFVDRRAGESKMSAGIALEAGWRVLLFRFRKRSPPAAPLADGARTQA
jgi:dolichol-phosphate mannosyltransferase